MALTLTHITCDYAGGSAMASRALEDVSLTVECGDLVLVLGPTGSGKTTLLRAAAGLLPIASGAVEADGQAVRGPVGGGAVGLVFQRPESQFFSLSVEEDCAFGPRNMGLAPKEALSAARDALTAVGLDPAGFGPREPWTLSGGEARRVALAGVLAMRPRYLLLDEPTAGLDATACESVLAVIEEARSRAGVVVVTHDPDRFVDAASQVMVLRAARQVFSGAVPAFLEALPQLASAGLAEPPQIPGALMLASVRAAEALGPLTLDAPVAAGMLAAALARGGAR